MEKTVSARNMFKNYTKTKEYGSVKRMSDRQMPKDWNEGEE
jgi:hypothetical protein